MIFQLQQVTAAYCPLLLLGEANSHGSLWDLLFSLVCVSSHCSETTLLDEPFVENGETVVLPAPANDSNVSIIIICNVSFQGTPLATHWYLTLSGERRTSVLDMNDPNF